MKFIDYWRAFYFGVRFLQYKNYLRKKKTVKSGNGQIDHNLRQLLRYPKIARHIVETRDIQPVRVSFCRDHASVIVNGREFDL